MLSSADVVNIRQHITRNQPHPSGRWRLRHNRRGGWRLTIRGPVGTESLVADLPDLPSHADALRAVQRVMNYHSQQVSPAEVAALISTLSMLVDAATNLHPN